MNCLKIDKKEENKVEEEEDKVEEEEEDKVVEEKEDKVEEEGVTRWWRRRCATFHWKTL